MFFFNFFEVIWIYSYKDKIEVFCLRLNEDLADLEFIYTEKELEKEMIEFEENAKSNIKYLRL